MNETKKGPFDDDPKAKAIIDLFHQIYYHSNEKTWENTFWMGYQTLKCPLDMWIYQEILCETKPDIIIIEGQGSLMNPAYPGGFEILAAGRPDVIVLQHAPARKDYDGFPGYPIDPLEKQIQAIELISEKPVVAVTVNRENLIEEEIPSVCADIFKATGLSSVEVLLDGAGQVVEALIPFLKR